MDINTIKPDEILDCLGLGCPLPILKTTQKIKEMQTDRVLEVLAGDEGLQRDMLAWCKKTGHEYPGTREENGEYQVYVRKRQVFSLSSRRRLP